MKGDRPWEYLVARLHELGIAAWQQFPDQTIEVMPQKRAGQALHILAILLLRLRPRLNR